MKEKIGILKLLEPTAIQAANVRSHLVDYEYIEVDNLMIISYDKRGRDKVKEKLEQEADLKYCLIHINQKPGNKAYIKGLNNGDRDTITRIIEDLS